MALTNAQKRMVEEIRACGGADEDGAQYWDVANGWSSNMPHGFVLVNIQRTFSRLIRIGVISLDDEGYVRLAKA